jgi:signal transduction histidine kinase
MIQKTFKVSSALKNIIGKDLITNEFIAVFELVKNSFDAHAKQVDVTFKDLKTSSPKLIIQDNGKGMDLHDLENKWLFVAYSAKKDGTEDYRDTIVSNRIHAGAKGIGRFSCDRLGKSLKIYTKKETSKSTDLLTVNWEAFERDAQEEFEDVGVSYETTTSTPYGLKCGTVLEINDLRENWDRDRIIKLRRSLEKLVNPNQDNDSDNFSINLYAPDYEESDRNVKRDEPWNRVNGPVENFLFERIGIRTTFINVVISENGEKIRTRLEDRGTLIFELTERNPYKYDSFTLQNIEVSLFALNRGAKTAFTKYMGTQPVNFGSVFVYKNGFRINPMGDPGHDNFQLDRRKTQGTARFLGSRDLFGRIEISGDNPEFQEASSRDGGLVTNEATELLQDFFLNHVLRRLEAYAVDIIKYGNLGTDFDSALQEDTDIKSKILALIQNLTKSDEILDVHYDPNVVDVFEELSEKSIQGLLRNFKKIASRNSSKDIENEVIRAEARLAELDRARREAEAEADKAKRDRIRAEREAKAAEEARRKAEAEADEAKEDAEDARQETEKAYSENLFLRSMANTDITDTVSFVHHIGIAAETIENYVKNFSLRIRKGQSYSEETILESLSNISSQARKILTTTKFITKANFSLKGSDVEADLCEYLEEYIENICSGVIKNVNDENMIFEFRNQHAIEFRSKFHPLEISIILDNLISNAKRAKAKRIFIDVVERDEKHLNVIFSDDGKGILEKSADRLFEIGFTTTSGSGLGLGQTKKLLEKRKGDIQLVAQNELSGAAFELRFAK